MPGTITLRVLQPGPRADELLAAVAKANDRDSLKPSDGPSTVVLWADDVKRARELTEQALDAAGDDGRQVVRLLDQR